MKAPKKYSAAKLAKMSKAQLTAYAERHERYSKTKREKEALLKKVAKY